MCWTHSATAPGPVGLTQVKALDTVLLAKKSHYERLVPLGKYLHCYSTCFDDEVAFMTR
jgi:hypothetical protein